MATRGAFAACLLALAGCPTVDLGDTPPDVAACNPAGGMAYFNAMMWPDYLDLPSPINGQKCTKSGCHGVGTFSGGFGLDTTNPMAAGNFRVTQGELQPGGCQMPAANLLVTRPLNLDGAHGGGQLFRTTDPQYQTYLGWFK